MKKLFLSILSILLINVVAFSQTAQQKQAWQSEFQKLSEKEISQEDYIKLKYEDFKRVENIKAGKLKAFSYKIVNPNNICADGGFETSSLTNNWTGSLGKVDGNGNPNALSVGINSHLVITDTLARQTIVNTGNDPFVSLLSTVHTGTKALRLGNALTGRGYEAISKKIIITPSNSMITFWFALVMQNPNHSNNEVPKFMVKVVDEATNTEIQNVVNLGNNSNFIRSNDPMLVQGSGMTKYRNWSCTQINLSNHIGKTVVIEFSNQDCTLGAHWGYTYIDDICGSCGSGNPTGSIQLNIGNTNCKEKRICFDYSLPNNGTLTGSINISLQIRQNGSTVQTLNSGNLTSGTSHCFNVPANINGGFDYVATGNFSINGNNVNTLTLGTLSDGQLIGRDNDCAVTPNLPNKSCCPNSTLIIEERFTSNTPNFQSDYTNVPLFTNKPAPSEYTINDLKQITKICNQWNLGIKDDCKHEGVMVVNGQTQQPANQSNVVYKKQFSKSRFGSFKFCADFMHLPVCCFDIKPKITIEIIEFGSVRYTKTIQLTSSTIDCGWQKISEEFMLGSSPTAELRIKVEETPNGDGNDFLIDNIYLVELTQPLAINWQAQTNTTSLNVTAQINSPSLVTPCAYSWGIGKLENGTISNVTWGGAADGWGTTTTFPNYTIDANSVYAIILIANCPDDCFESYLGIKYVGGSAAKVQQAEKETNYSSLLELAKKSYDDKIKK